MIDVEKRRARQKRYYEKHKEKLRENAKKKYHRKKEEPGFLEKRRAYNKRPEVKERERKRKHTPKYQTLQRKYVKRPEVKKRRSKRVSERYVIYKDEVLQEYSKGVPKCKCCGVKGKEFLAIDHINGRKQMDTEPELRKIGYSSKLIGYALWLWIRKNNFPKGFQVLCHNCNYAKGVLGKCPHKD